MVKMRKVVELALGQEVEGENRAREGGMRSTGGHGEEGL